MTDKELKDWCKTCGVEPPAMKFKCPECEHNPDKEQIIIDGVNIIGTIDEWARLVAHEWGTDEYSDAEIVKNYILDINKQLARKTQGNEELENKIKKLRKNLALKIEINARYRKALMEIAEVWAKDKDGDYDFVKRQIFNIINKAKGK